MTRQAVLVWLLDAQRRPVRKGRVEVSFTEGEGYSVRVGPVLVGERLRHLDAERCVTAALLAEQDRARGDA